MSDLHLVLVAEIIGAFGVKGAGKIRSFTAKPEACFAAGPLLDKTASPLITVKTLNAHGKGQFIITGEEARSREDWQALRGTKLYLHRADLPHTQDPDEFYVCDLIGCALIHADGRNLGIVHTVHDFGAGELLEIKAATDFMLPFTKALVPQIDLERRQILTVCEDVYLPADLVAPS